MDNFNVYLSEYQATGVGTLIYSLIFDITVSVVKHYPPEVYSPNGVWDDDAISGICNDFIFNKLLGKGWLDSYFLAIDSINGLRGVLKRDFKHYLISKKARTEKSNLFVRVKKTLNDNPKRFQSFSKSVSDGNPWGLSYWTNKEVTQDIYFVTQATASIELPRLIRYRSDSRKTSPLISSQELINLIEKIFVITDKKMPLNILFDAICNRLGIVTGETISLDDPIDNESEQVLGDIIADPNTPEATVSSKQIAENIYEQLSDRQREVLSLRFSIESSNIVEIGQQLGISKSTVSSELSNIEQIIKDNQTDSSGVDQIIQFLKELLLANQVASRS